MLIIPGPPGRHNREDCAKEFVQSISAMSSTPPPTVIPTRVEESLAASSLLQIPRPRPSVHNDWHASHYLSRATEKDPVCSADSDGETLYSVECLRARAGRCISKSPVRSPQSGFSHLKPAGKLTKSGVFGIPYSDWRR